MNLTVKFYQNTNIKVYLQCYGNYNTSVQNTFASEHLTFWIKKHLNIKCQSCASGKHVFMFCPSYFKAWICLVQHELELHHCFPICACFYNPGRNKLQTQHNMAVPHAAEGLLIKNSGAGIKAMLICLAFVFMWTDSCDIYSTYHLPAFDHQVCLDYSIELLWLNCLFEQLGCCFFVFM